MPKGGGVKGEGSDAEAEAEAGVEGGSGGWHGESGFCIGLSGRSFIFTGHPAYNYTHAQGFVMGLWPRAMVAHS